MAGVGVPKNVTESLPAVALKLLPSIVTDVPAGPLVGVKPEMAGTGIVKLVELVPVNPPTVTVIGPDVAPLGTRTTSCVVVAELTVAAVPLNLTASLALVELKLVPVMVTDVLTPPLVGENPVMVGGVVMVKLVPLVPVCPLTATVIVPDVAEAGTATTNCVVVDDETDAVVP